jgi:CheY-like chemotaxis protein
LAKERKSILIVEDCVDTRQMIKYALRHAGFKSVYEAADGVEGLKIMQRQPIALVITDWRMPNMDGLAFVQNATSGSRRKF